MYTCTGSECLVTMKSVFNFAIFLMVHDNVSLKWKCLQIFIS